MSHHTHSDGSRRDFLRALAAAPFLMSAQLTGELVDGQLTPTPSCGDDDDDEPTPPQTEGPYFTPRSPRRVSLLESGLIGTRLVVGGRVLTRSCRPVTDALVDFWQCDAAGHYDNQGYRLRGHQLTGRDGAFRLETVVPGLYPGRTRHIHVKVQAPGRPVLTTQLYFPDEPQNRRDRIFHPELLMRMTGSGDARQGRFDFILDLA